MSGAHRDFVVPPVIEQQSRAWLATPEAERVVGEPRASSTVMLLRQGSGGPEVFVLRRAMTMAFAGGMYAFPGGGVDRRDADPGVPWAGPGPDAWAARLRTDETTARELVIAAAREVFEEAGVLLAGPDPDTVVTDVEGQEWETEREHLLDRSQSFGELLTRRGLVLRSDLLVLRAHWTTPVAEPKRYDTRFFAARMPEGQQAEGRTSESVEARWVRPADLLQDAADGRAVLLPPTLVMLEQLARAQDVDTWLAEVVDVHPVLPHAHLEGDRMVMRVPVDEQGHGLPPAED